jgi:uncharacterized protein (TIGR03435 family)
MHPSRKKKPMMIEFVEPRLHIRIRQRPLGACAMAAWMVASATALAQTGIPLQAPTATAPINQTAASQWEIAAGGKRFFDVASVRLSPPDAPTRGNEVLSPLDGEPFKGGLFTANSQLLAYIVFAYKIADASQYPLRAQLPKWSQSDQFDIEARAPTDVTTDQMRLMLQAVLEDRFKLAIHSETKQLPVYALILDKPDKPGLQLRMHPDGVPCIDKPDKPAPLDPGSAPPPYCGMDAWQANGELHMRMVDVTIDQVAIFLGGAAGSLGGMDRRPVLDQTGLKGKFDMNIEFVKDQGRSATAADFDVAGPTFAVALKHQLGLKLEKQVAPANMFVIDHVELPTPQ